MLRRCASLIRGTDCSRGGGVYEHTGMQFLRSHPYNSTWTWSLKEFAGQRKKKKRLGFSPDHILQRSPYSIRIAVP